MIFLVYLESGVIDINFNTRLYCWVSNCLYGLGLLGSVSIFYILVVERTIANSIAINTTGLRRRIIRLELLQSTYILTSITIILITLITHFKLYFLTKRSFKKMNKVQPTNHKQISCIKNENDIYFQQLKKQWD
ncbi:Hypothetical protein SRAE_1000107900 [Strongyloides ratti]|uniref:Uncharacterized protein n=1 Tax=Strongyloides ratti TaxID=34506 RepID=A0A090KZ65_STRRB|nr:Hypothetical protein SRAE_1000107900 [Strongyloides ratti]CEF62810.1 Hypothetical protein SRAE_1000107900 [Strongyloides ratti]